jgi:ubiquinone/menaquinone biosynthesis C-methylase UbiE
MSATWRARIPAPVRAFLQRVRDVPGDMLNALRRGPGRPVPPRRMVTFVGGGDFEKIGREFMEHLVALGGLTPDDVVLDVGCGAGRVALPLTRFLSGAGRYEGFDIAREEVAWCTKHITPSFPAFRFQYVDLYNSVYNPGGILQPLTFRFPYADRTFTFVLLTSVFTHLLLPELEHYLKEIARVTRPRAHVFVTFFLLNTESRPRIEDGQSTLAFHHHLAGAVTTDPQKPEAAVAYDEQDVRGMFERYGFAITSVHAGSWCGRTDAVSYQDIVVAERSGT